MRTALLSDIHGNAPALRAVLADIEAQGIEKLWVLGDVLGYGPLPIACINLLDAWCPEVWLMGNHDWGALRAWEELSADDFEIDQVLRDSKINQLAPGLEERQILVWHAVQLRMGLPSSRIERLKETPTWQLLDGGVLAAHGAVLSADPDSINNIIGQASYCFPWAPPIDSTCDTVLQLKMNPLPRLVVVGHTHRPTWGQAERWPRPRHWTWEADDPLYEQADGLKKLPEPSGGPVLVCPGSVGQPRFVQDTRAAYAVVDLEQETVHFKRVGYEEGEWRAAQVLVPDDAEIRHDWWRVTWKSLNEWIQKEKQDDKPPQT